MDDKWSPGTFHRAGREGARATDGYLYAGLAMAHTGWASPRTETRWRLYHLGSGGCLFEFTGDVATLFPVMTQVAECTDWTLFDHPDGWKQTDPDLPAKVGAILRDNPQARVNLAMPEGPTITDQQYREVIAAREGTDQ